MQQCLFAWLAVGLGGVLATLRAQRFLVIPG